MGAVGVGVQPGNDTWPPQTLGVLLEHALACGQVVLPIVHRQRVYVQLSCIIQTTVLPVLLILLHAAYDTPMPSLSRRPFLHRTCVAALHITRPQPAVLCSYPHVNIMLRMRTSIVSDMHCPLALLTATARSRTLVHPTSCAVVGGQPRVLAVLQRRHRRRGVLPCHAVLAHVHLEVLPVACGSGRGCR